MMLKSPIDRILEELDKTSAFLRKFRESGHIPDIERDIILSKLRNIYEFIQLVQLERTDANTVSKVPKNEEEEQAPEIIVESKQPSDQQETSEKVSAGPLPQKEGPEKNAAIEETTPAVEGGASAKPGMSAKKEILAEKFQGQGFLNEALAQYQNMPDVSKKIQNQPLANISSAINLNDKYLYIKQLFESDALLYQTTIEKINNAGSFNEAIRYLDENFTWDFNDPQVQKFLELVRRRYLHAS